MSATTTNRCTRHTALARSIGARLFINVEGRIFVVGGRPVYDKLAACLSNFVRPPHAAEAPSPHDLGYHTCDGELDDALLHSIRRALHRWRKDLDRQAQRLSTQRRQSPNLAREYHEVAQLQARLAHVRHWQSELRLGNEPAGAPLFLDANSEHDLKKILLSAAHHFARHPFVAWQARVIYWLAGPIAVQRYLAAMQMLFGESGDEAMREQIRDMQALLLTWKKRSQHEPLRHLRQELANHIQTLHPNVNFLGRFSARLRERSFAAHCEEQYQRCANILTHPNDLRWHQVPAALAALVAADGSHQPLPKRCFETELQKQRYQLMPSIIHTLGKLIGKKGYDRLLTALDQLPQSLYEGQYAHLCRLLGAGNSVADAVWLCERQLLENLNHDGLKIATVRGLHEQFAQCGWKLDNHELWKLTQQLGSPGHVDALRLWLRWLGSVSSRAITPQLLKSIKRVLWDVYLPCIRWPHASNPFATCLEPLRSRQQANDTTALLAKVVACQQHSGKQAELPKSLRSQVQWHERRNRERAHLANLRDQGQLDPSAAARLQYLEGAPPPASSANQAKLLRTIEEMFLTLGLDAQRYTAQRLAEAKCREHLGDLTQHLNQEQLGSFAGWIEEMSPAERRRLAELLAVRALHDANYKRHLAENQPWLAKAIQHGVDINIWLRANREELTIGGQSVEIELASDLHHLFQMGTYFGTCLSLGQVNQLSVLTNAYDANKQVVFMFTRDTNGSRQVLARQLLTISSDFKLLGYCCYLSYRRLDKDLRQAGLDAMAGYCGRLAARCNLALTDEGTPEEWGGHFWYDDGTQPWPALARVAQAEMPVLAISS